MSDKILLTPEHVEKELKDFWPISLSEIPTFNELMQEKYGVWPSELVLKEYKKLFHLRLTGLSS